jgi:pyruvate dehydrogenase E2 component (dihydrolipoamide acetyltransferase)
MVKDVTIPEISENVTSGKVVAVLVKAGDMVEVDQPIIEFETEKAVVEIPSPHKGRVAEILVEEGDELKVGEVIARIETGEGAGETDAPEEKTRAKERSAKAGQKAPRRAEEEGLKEEKGREEPEGEATQRPAGKPGREEAKPKERTEAEKEGQAPAQETRKGAEQRPAPAAGEEEARGRGEAKHGGPAPASPSVRRFARELGVDIHEVRPAEPGGRISEADVRAYVRRASIGNEEKEGIGGPRAGVAARRPVLPDFTRWGEV